MSFKTLWNFLGSIWLAILLLTTTAIWVILATIIESKTGSHLAASSFAYDHVFFKFLLVGYFINILVSSLKRYPYKKRHIPFLITHLGLLMVIGGTFVKIRYGVQGTVILLEGSGSHTLVYPNTKAVHIQQRAPKKSLQWDLTNGDVFEGIILQWIDSAPHGKQVWKGWFQNDQVHILGFAPIPVGETEKNVQALITDDVAKSIERSYEKHLKVSLHGILLTGSRLEIDSANGTEFLVLPQGKKIRLDQTLPDGIVIENRPQLLFLKDSDQTTTIVAINEKGELKKRHYPLDDLGTIIVYDEGFLGYAAKFDMAGFLMESTLLREVQVLPPPLKLEDSRPIIKIKAKKGKVKETLDLVFDPTGQALKVPALHGQILLSYSPKTEEMPYHLRLRRARQIFYPGTKQPQSYECDLFVTDIQTGQRCEATLSMNQVYETKEGWRFYLSAMTPKDETDIKRVQLAVNFDPAKYVLTYPGALLVGLGIVLLFFQRIRSNELK
jgi:hypothetical protein